jgi:hypothetical protein
VRFLAALAFAVALAGQRVAPPASVKVEGILVNSVTGAGIAGATVTVGAHQAVTALDGTFTLTGVESPKMIVLSARMSGLRGSTRRKIRSACAWR